MEPLAALAERVLFALVRAGDKPVQRDRDVTSELTHRSSWQLRHSLVLPRWCASNPRPSSQSAYRWCEADAGVVRLRFSEAIPIPRDRTTSEAGCKPRERGVQSNDIAVVDRAGGVGHEVAEPQHAAGVHGFQFPTHV